jgi:hypothetical protein
MATRRWGIGTILGNSAVGRHGVGSRMAGTTESRKFGRAEDVSGSAIVDIASEAIFRARRPSAVSESITRLMSITQWGQSAADCLAIVGPQEPASREAQRIANWANRRCRIEVFSDRMAPDEETGKTYLENRHWSFSHARTQR